MACQLDKEMKYEEALAAYKQCLDYWKIVLKYNSNPQLKEVILAKMQEYVKRAEDIKSYLDTAKSVPVAVEPGSSSPRSGNASNNPTTKELEKMQEAMASVIVTEKPNVKWDDVAGLQGAKDALHEAIVLPTRFPQLFSGDLKPWKGILLYGPPGTGKSFLAKACATEVAGCFFSVSSSDLVSKWQGESEKLIRSLFELARKNAPSIIFIDEIDSMASARSDNESESSRRIKTEFLVQMEGVGKSDKGVLILGATNIPWDLDSAIRRRFERRIYIPLPDYPARRYLLEILFFNSLCKCKLTRENIDQLAYITDGYSGADISVMVRDIKFQPIRKCQAATHFKQVQVDGKSFLQPCAPGDPDPSKREMTLMEVSSEMLLPPEITMDDCLGSASRAKKSVNDQDLFKFDKWTKDFGIEN